MNPETLLFRLRAETLRTNYATTLSHIEELPRKPEWVRCLEDIAGVSDAILDLKIELIKMQRDTMHAPVPGEIEQRLNTILNTNQKASAALEKLRTLQFLESNGSILSDLSGRLSGRRSHVERHFGKLATQLGSGGGIQPEDWKAFHDQMQTPSRDLFNFCVDLLGGIAIRDSRFDAGISALADDLVHYYSQAHGDSGSRFRAIPARSDRSQVSLARIVRLGFPDWTVWALPLTAYDFWHANRRDDLVERVNDVLDEDDRPRFRSCLADAFATFVMGPAYAYATIGLLLDPRATRGTEAEVADDIRATTILEMLRFLDRRFGPGDEPCRPHREVLGMAWEAAKSQQGVAYCSPSEERDGADREAAGRLTAELALALDEGSNGPLTPEAWAETTEWQKVLRQRHGMVAPEPKLPQELRQVLNAAWLARVDAQRDNQITLAELNERALELARRVQDARVEARPGTRTPVPGSGRFVS